MGQDNKELCCGLFNNQFLQRQSFHSSELHHLCIPADLAHVLDACGDRISLSFFQDVMTIFPSSSLSPQSGEMGEVCNAVVPLRTVLVYH